MKSIIATAVAGIATAANVQTEIYVESLCPYCKSFTVETLAPFFKEVENVDFNYITYGNAKIVDDEVICQHGKPECDYNKVMVCAVERLGGLPLTQEGMDFLECYEDLNKGKKLSLEGCVPKELEAPIQACADGAEGEALHREMGRRTGPHKHVPWCKVNGEDVNCQGEFERAVCSELRASGLPEGDYCEDLLDGIKAVDASAEEQATPVFRS